MTDSFLMTRAEAAMKAEGCRGQAAMEAIYVPFSRRDWAPAPGRLEDLRQLQRSLNRYCCPLHLLDKREHENEGLGKPYV